MATDGAGSGLACPAARLARAIRIDSATLQADYGPRTEAEWQSDLPLRAEGQLKGASPEFTARQEPGSQEYVLRIRVDFTGLHYWVAGYLYNATTALIVKMELVKQGVDIYSAVGELISQFGDVLALFEQGALTYTQTDPSGHAHADYRLDRSRGTHPGTDTVKVWTHGQRLRMTRAHAEIKIVSWKGRREIEKSPEMLGMGLCTYESKCVVHAPFHIARSDSAKGHEIVGEGPDTIPYRLVCGANCLTGDFGAMVVGGSLDAEGETGPTIRVQLKIWRDNEVHFVPTCEQPMMTIPRGERAEMETELYDWPLIDGHSKQIGVFTYTLHLDETP